MSDRYAIECAHCGAELPRDAVDDMELDQCPDCGHWTSFEWVLEGQGSPWDDDGADEDDEERDS